MQFRKIMVALGVLLCLCTNINAVSYADNVAPFFDYGISPNYEIANSPDSILSIEDGTAYCSSSTTGANTASITVTQTLQKHWGLWIWSNVKGASWSKEVNGGSICLTSSKSGLDSGTYRVKSVFTLTDKDGKSETITIYSNKDNVT